MDKYERAKASQQAQIAKYGGIEGYRAEMQRRRGLVKNPHQTFTDKQKAKEASKKGLNKRWNKDEDSTQRPSASSKEQ